MQCDLTWKEKCTLQLLWTVKKDQHVNVANVTISINPHETSNLLCTLCVKVGVHVMLTNDIYAPDGLTNVAMGPVANIAIEKHNSRGGKLKPSL